MTYPCQTLQLMSFQVKVLTTPLNLFTYHPTGFDLQRPADPMILILFSHGHPPSGIYGEHCHQEKPDTETS